MFIKLLGSIRTEKLIYKISQILPLGDNELTLNKATLEDIIEIRNYNGTEHDIKIALPSGLIDTAVQALGLLRHYSAGFYRFVEDNAIGIGHSRNTDYADINKQSIKLTDDTLDSGRVYTAAIIVHESNHLYFARNKICIFDEENICIAKEADFLDTLAPQLRSEMSWMGFPYKRGSYLGLRRILRKVAK